MYLEDSKKEKTNMLMCLKVDKILKSLLINIILSFHIIDKYYP